MSREALCETLWWLVRRRENSYVDIGRHERQIWLPSGVSDHEERMEYLESVIEDMYRLDFIRTTPNEDLKCRLNGRAAAYIKARLMTCGRTEKDIDRYLRRFRRSGI